MTTPQPKRHPIPFGKYLLLDRINIGGMAEVWRGKMFGAGGFERLVAIKRILPNIAEDHEFITMFVDEAKLSGQLNHANIAKIEELGQISNSYFIAMEYIPGKDMRAIFDHCRKKGEPAPVPLVAYVVSKLCEGLDYAHRKKDNLGRDLHIVHRDISPQNVLISFEGEVKVIDFGIAKAAGKAYKTQAGMLKGKFGYMSPEQIRGLPLDQRSDVFAIGVCLYELLTGERLFVGDSDFSVLEKVRKAEVPSLSTSHRHIPEALEKIVRKALAREVEDRYRYANELGDDLQRFLLTSETLFGRKDLMQYMKSTFAEDVESEKQRQQEYADIKPPESMLAAIEMGFSGASSAPQPMEPTALQPPSPATTGGVRRSPTLSGMPRLTATPVATPKSLQEEEESGATMVVNRGEVFDEPTLQRESVGPGLTAAPVTAAPVESTLISHQGRNTLERMPRVARPETPVLEQSPGGARPSQSVPAVLNRPAPSPLPMAAPAPAAPNRLPLIVGLAAMVVVLLGVVGFLWPRPVPTGYLLVNLPSAVQASVRVNVNGQELSVPRSGPILQQVKAGPSVVLVSAKGYKPFTRSMVIEAGTKPSSLDVKLEREVEVARMVIVTQPPDAELKVDGKVVREQGSRATYLGELTVGTEVTVVASAPGFNPVEKRVTADAGDKPLDVQLTLEPEGFEVEVLSVPSGATILAGGKEWGVTPARVRLPASVRQMGLKLRCYDDVDVEVAPAAEGALAQVRERLKKQRRCH